MKFLISRASIFEGEPCKEASLEDITHLDFRTAATLKEARKCSWGKEWFRNGTNHREDRTKKMVVRDIPKRDWVINIPSLKALLGFIGKYGDIIILESNCKEYPYEIEIYDDYIE